MTSTTIRLSPHPDFTGVAGGAVRILRRVRAVPRLLRLRHHVRMADIAFALASAQEPVTAAERWARRYTRGRF